MDLDRYDRAILRLLQQDARITNTLLAGKVSLSESACLRRVRALEESGLIQGYTALIDQHKAGFPANVFVSITLDRQSQAGLEAFESAVRKVPEVMECYLMTGEYDYLLRIVVAELAARLLGHQRRMADQEFRRDDGHPPSLAACQLAAHRQHHAPRVVAQHVHAVDEERVHRIRVQIAPPALEMRPRRDPPHPS